MTGNFTSSCLGFLYLKSWIIFLNQAINAPNTTANIIAKDLVKEDIYFVGIDFIDEKLNGDINVTSPTGLKTFFDLSNINLADYFWKGLRAWKISPTSKKVP